MNSTMKMLQRFAESVMVALMAVMFSAFIAQVVFRYVLNLPLAWSDEICNFIWLWGILWGASFVMKNHEDIRFDMIYNFMPRSLKRSFTTISSVFIVLLLAVSLPATWAFIDFMKVEKSAALSIPMNGVFGLYIVFILAMCIRHLGIAVNAVRNRLTEDEHNLIDQDFLNSGNKS